MSDQTITLNLSRPEDGGVLSRRASGEALVGVVHGEGGLGLAHLGDAERGSAGCHAVEGPAVLAAEPDVRGVPHRCRSGSSTGKDPPSFTRNERSEGDAEEDPAGEPGTKVHRVLGAVRSGNGDGGGGLAVVAGLGGLSRPASRVGDGGEELVSRKLITDAGTTGRFHLLREPVRVVIIDLNL